MDNQNTLSPDLVSQAVDLNIEDRSQDALRAAQRVPGVSQIEGADQRAQQAKRAEDRFAGRGGLSVATESLMRTGSDINASGAIIRELADRSHFMDDPNWKPRQNMQQQTQLMELVKDLPEEYQKSILSAGSFEAAKIQKEYARQEMESMQFISDAGIAKGYIPMAAGSLLDVDAPIGLGIFSKMAKARKLGKLAAVGEGVAAGTAAALVTQGVNSELRPTVGAQDVWGAMLINAGIGGLLGPAGAPAAKFEKNILNRTIDSTNAAKDVASQLAEDVSRIKSNATKRKDNPAIDGSFEQSLQRVVLAEGGFADNPADKGGPTIFGVSSKHNIETYNQIIDAMNKGDRKAAADLVGGVYQTKYWQDAGIDNIKDPVSRFIAFDASVNQGPAFAKKMIEQVGENPHALLEYRQKAYNDIVANDPSQAVFAVGWQKRLDNIRADINPNTEYNKSVGAMGLARNDMQVSPTTSAWNDRAYQYWEDNPDALREYHYEPVFGQKPIQRLANSIYEGIQKTPFKSDYDRMRSLKSPVADMVNHMLLESPLGIARNRRSANNLSFHMYEEVAKDVSPHLSHNYRMWTKDNNINMLDSFRDTHQLEFTKQIQRELETRRWEGKSAPDSHPAVIEMADNFDRANQKMLHYTQGKDGAPAVKGMEDVEFKSGWYRRKWRADKLAKLESEVGTAKILNALATGMAKVSDIDIDTAQIMAKAIVRRTKEDGTGAAFGAFGSVGNDGKAFIAQAFKDHLPNATDEEIMQTVDRVFGLNPDRGKAGFARSKMDIDMRTPIEGTKYTLLDLIENDITAAQERYYRSAANLSALARKGIQREDIPSLRTAMIEEARASGTYTEGTGKFLDDVFSYFGDGAYAGGAGPLAGRLNKLAIMSYLGNLGITQLAEVGAMMGVSGIKSFTHYAKQTIPEMLKGKDPEVLKSLHAAGFYAGDHRLVVRAITMDDMDLETKHAMLKALDRWSDKGMRAMGYISGFYKVTEMMNTMAALTGQDYIVRSVAAGKNLSRLKDMGVDEAFQKTINKYIKDGTVEFDAEGFVKDMHYEKWNPVDAEDAVLAIKTHVRQVVQKPQRGETANWWHGQTGSLFMSLRNFTFTAAQKQTLRNMRHADPEAMMSLLYGTGTAAIAWSARQELNGTLQDKTPIDIAKGAIQWGNMTSPALMITDPLSYLLGADRIPGSPFPMNDWRYTQQGLMSMPAGISAVNQLAGLTRIPSDLIDDGELGRESINAIKALPVIGRSYPMIPILRALEKDK